LNCERRHSAVFEIPPASILFAACQLRFVL
jgi:hypothetical protein